MSTKEIINKTKNSYSGSFLGFNYSIELKDDIEFETWLRAKIGRYVLTELEIRLLRDILGIDLLEARILALEKKLGI